MNRHRAAHLSSLVLVLAVAGVPQALSAATRALPADGWWRGFGYPGAFWGAEYVTSWNGGLVLAGHGSMDGESLPSPAFWDGAAWSPLRGPLGQPTITGFHVWTGRLLATGTFYGLPAGQVAEWRDGAWRALGEPVFNLRGVSTDGQRLLALSGETILEWSEDGWISPGPPLAIVRSLVLHEDEIVAVEDRALENSTARVTVAVALRDGSWRDLGFLPHGGAHRLMSAGGVLYDAWYEGSAHATHVLRLDGGAWTRVGDPFSGHVRLVDIAGTLHGITGPVAWWDNDPAQLFRLDGTAWTPVAGPVGGAVFGTTVHEGRLVVAGAFVTAGLTAVSGLAVLEGETWSPVRSADADPGRGANFDVNALLPYGGRLVVAGGFVTLGGGVRTGIAIGDGRTFHPLGDGMDDAVFALAEFEGDLVAAGDFLSAGTAAAARVARWDGAAWHPVGAGFDDRVTALAVWRGTLHAAGWFRASGAAPASAVARWDGAAWQPLGPGLDGTVAALLVHEDRLVAGGSFRSPGEAEARNIAAWDGGSWSALPGLPVGAVTALTVWDGRLVAGGQFRDPSGARISCVAAWNGTGWDPVGGTGPDQGSGLVQRVTSLTPWRGRLAVGADMGTSWLGRHPDASPVIFFDGTDWLVPTAGPQGPVHAVADRDGSLFVGGSFLSAGGVSAFHLTRWDETLVAAPVEDPSLRRDGSRVRLTWTASAPSNRYGYEVFRQAPGTERAAAGVPDRSGDAFAFEDDEPSPGGADYWLREFGPFDSEAWHGPYRLAPLPAGAVFGPPAPNPFRTTTAMAFSLAAPSPVTVEAFDVQGRRIRTLLDAGFPPGTYSVVWDGRDDLGTPAPSGIYWIRARTSDGPVAHRVALVR